MNWFKNLKEKSGLRVGSLKTGQRLPGALVGIIIALDIYLITVIFQGIGWTSEKIATPVEKITPALLSVAKKPAILWPNKLILPAPDAAQKSWGLAGKSPSVGAYIEYNERTLDSAHSYSYDYIQEYNYSAHGYSKRWSGLGNSKISKEANQVMRENWNQSLPWVNALKQYNSQISALDTEIAGLVRNYDTMLREKSAKLAAEKSLMPSSADDILQRIKQNRAALETLIARRNILIDKNTPVAAVSSWINSKAAEIQKEDANNHRWYSLLVNLAQLAFMLPILVAAVLWQRHNTRSTTAEVSTLVSSHLVYIAAIPVLFKVIEFVNYIIPYKLFSDLFKWVWDAGLQYLWSYILILIGIGIIFILGKWIVSHSKKTKAKFYLQCLEKNRCPKTGKGLPPGCRYSPYTGEPLFRNEDGKESYRYAPFSSQTGQANPDWEELTK